MENEIPAWMDNKMQRCEAPGVSGAAASSHKEEDEWDDASGAAPSSPKEEEEDEWGDWTSADK